MTRHIDDSLLQDFREGLLDPEAVVEVREHLDTCSQCRAELAALTELLEGLGGLPAEVQPPRDLWPQIAWRMETAKTLGPGSADVEQHDAAAYREPPRGRPRVARRVNLPAWQLLAASIALMVISGGTVWAVLSGKTDGGGSLGPVPQNPAQLATWEDAYGGYDEAVADLEAVLARGREVLDPETVLVLEENLQAIDRAIQEAGEALLQDPGSTVLQRFLAINFRKKVDLLRQAAGAVYATT
ncbi:MAG: zf-HC2 domain-containing protein [Gemmatimonadota bacterium]